MYKMLHERIENYNAYVMSALLLLLFPVVCIAGIITLCKSK